MIRGRDGDWQDPVEGRRYEFHRPFNGYSSGVFRYHNMSTGAFVFEVQPRIEAHLELEAGEDFLPGAARSRLTPYQSARVILFPEELLDVHVKLHRWRDPLLDLADALADSARASRRAAQATDAHDTAMTGQKEQDNADDQT